MAAQPPSAADSLRVAGLPRHHCCSFAAAAILKRGKRDTRLALPVVSPFCSICLSALFIKRRSSSHARTLTHSHTLTQRQTGCILYVFKLLSDILFCLSGAERHGSTFIPGLRALASIPDSAACIILARCPDYASAASRAPLDRVSFLFTLLVFLFIFSSSLAYTASQKFGVTDLFLH